MTHRPWLAHYPAGVPPRIEAGACASLVQLIDEGLRAHAARPACKFMGRAWSYAQIDAMSRSLAAWLQGQGVQRGDRVAVMMPNLPQYPVAVAAVLRAGAVLVNVDPLYTARELEHQLKDSGARAIVVFEGLAHTLQQVLPALPMLAAQRVVIAATGDLLGPVRGRVANHVARRGRELAALQGVAGAVRFGAALAAGRRMPLQPREIGPDDIALLQYTGGTTGVSKGAVLLHRNLVANVLQSEAWNRPALARVEPGEQVHVVCALPLFHVFGFTCCLMLGLRIGACNILIPNPRDIGALLKELARHRFHSFPAVDTLFRAVAQHPDLHRVDWSALKLSVGGGMAVQPATARLWQHKTGCPICEGYGLSEASPSACANPTDASAFSGTIGMPLPSTDMRLVDDAGRAVEPGMPGEIAIRGPQVMAGYWQRPDETAKVLGADGWLRTGDIGVMDERGQFRIVGRKKDVILVSGFSVYPNEVEDVVARLPGVRECAVVGVPDARSGEAVKVVVVRHDAALGEADVRAWCEAHLAGYKRPRVVEFRPGLPRTAAGQVLRRELRAAASALV